MTNSSFTRLHPRCPYLGLNRKLGPLLPYQPLLFISIQTFSNQTHKCLKTPPLCFQTCFNYLLNQSKIMIWTAYKNAEVHHPSNMCDAVNDVKFRPINRTRCREPHNELSDAKQPAPVYLWVSMCMCEWWYGSVCFLICMSVSQSISHYTHRLWTSW